MNELTTTQPVQIVADSFCRQCGRRLSSTDNFCGECGTGRRDLIEIVDPMSRIAVSQIVTRPPSVVSSTGDEMQPFDVVVNNRLAVIGIIALLGPLALPALWFSPRFSRPTKIITTVTYVLLTTVLPIAIAWYWLDYSLRPLVDVFGK